jgi:uncharacterized protein YfdQ (DUF2303 family)
VAIYNYNGGADKPRFGDHRSVFDCTLSDEWKTWAARNGSTLSQHEFAAFIEDNIGDIQAKPDLPGDNYPERSASIMMSGLRACVGRA